MHLANKSAADCSIELKVGTVFHRVTPNDVQGQVLIGHDHSVKTSSDRRIIAFSHRRSSQGVSHFSVFFAPGLE